MSEKVEHTELPWVAHTKTGSPPFITRVSDNSGWICQTVTWCGVDEATANAEYIVLACNSYPALLAERDRLREALKEGATCLRLALKRLNEICPNEDASPEFDEAYKKYHALFAALKDTNQ